jgi:hypothetical protein
MFETEKKGFEKSAERSEKLNESGVEKWNKKYGGNI